MAADSRAPRRSRRLLTPSTPLAHVLLVVVLLLVATVPLDQHGLDVNLPRVRQLDARLINASQVVLTYDGRRRLSINSVPVEFSELKGRLREIFAKRQDRTLYVDADGTLRYGEVAKLIEVARGAGVTRVGLITDAMRRRH